MPFWSPAFYDLLVIGAGPTGLACAIDAQKAGFRVVLVDKGCLCNSLYHYPSHMTFFTTPELLEIGNIPFPSPNPSPAAMRRCSTTARWRLTTGSMCANIRTVERVTGSDGDFQVHTRDRFGRARISARKLVVATGYYDLPNYLEIPGENLSKVMHYYDDPHPYFGLDVVVIGGKNSAAIAALELWRHGARVTLVHRGPGIHRHVKYWIKPDIENRIKAGEVTAYFESQVVEITPTRWYWRRLRASRFSRTTLSLR
jgi:thioredoxin reductase (NADPH)